MQITEIKDKDIWDSFVSGLDLARFTQSWEWGELQKEEGLSVIRLGGMRDGLLAAAAGLAIKDIPGFGQYAFCPFGPVFAGGLSDKEVLGFYQGLKKSLPKAALFLRFESPRTHPEGLKAVKSLDLHASKTIILDLKKPAEEIQKDMHHKTRYNIRLAGKKGVRVGSGDRYFEDFWRITKLTAGRDGFRLHSQKHYRRLCGLEGIRLYAAIYKDKVIAANLVSFFGDTAIYLHGASDNEHRNVMAPYALQWAAIQDGLAKGLKYYDFFGIDQDKWPGVTRFKQGFGGREVHFPGTYDLVYSRGRYKAYQAARKIRRLLAKING